MTRHLIASLTFVAGTWITAAQGAPVTVEIHGLHSEEGLVMVAICEEKTYLNGACPYSGRVPVTAPMPITIDFADVAAGVYAVQVIHDENGNNELDTNFFGIPSEGYGFSNNPDVSSGAPDFEEAAITVGDDRLSVPVRMFYVFD